MQGSWKLSLRNFFKNFRKHYRATENDNEAQTTGELPAKRLRFYTGDESPVDDEEYEAAITKLQEEFRNKGSGKNRKSNGHGYVKNLMEITKIRRHQWIHSA